MKNIGVKYGLICGLVVVIAQLVGFIFETSSMGVGAGVVSWLVVLLITFYIIYRGCAEFKDINGNVTTGQGFKIGLTCGLIMGLIAGVFTLLYTQLIDTEFVDRMLDQARDQMEESGTPEAQIEQSLSITEMIFSPGIQIAFSIIMYAVGGMIKGPIAGAILHRSE